MSLNSIQDIKGTEADNDLSSCEIIFVWNLGYRQPDDAQVQNALLERELQKLF